MNSMLDFVFAPIHPFVGHPGRACVVAALFALQFAVSVARSQTLKSRQITIALTAATWAAFALQETIALANGWNIRVDLLVTAPIVLALSIAGIWCAIKSVFWPTQRLPDAGTTPTDD